MTKKITVASCAGACFGVKRALKIAQDAAQNHAKLGKADEPVCTLGPLIHNPLVVGSLEAQGVSVAHDPNAISEGTVILRSHGVTPELELSLKERGLTVLDATCPFVKNEQKDVELLLEQDYQIIIVGEPGHAEVESVAAYAQGEGHIVDSLEAAKALRLKKRVGVVVQTTQSQALLNEIVAYLLAHTAELRVFNTICAATSDRQAAAAKLASEVDVMIVIGGKNSGNTRRLAEISAEHCARVHHIEDIPEIQSSWFKPGDHIGITAGASTPVEQIEAVVAAIEAF